MSQAAPPPPHVEQRVRLCQVDPGAERTRGDGGDCRHRLPERLQHDGVGAVEEGVLLVRVPGGGSVVAQGVVQTHPPGVVMAVEHLHPAAEVGGTGAHEVTL